MAILKSFKAFRPQSQHAAKVASRPYDVLNSDEARNEAEGNPISFLHVGKPEIDLPRDIHLYDKRVYEKGAENLNKLIKDGVLKQDAHPCLYLYSQTMGQHTQTGIVGCVSVEEYLNEKIKKHELTRKDKEDDRTQHIHSTQAQTGPIFLTYRSKEKINQLVNKKRSEKPENDFVTPDGVRHQFWVIEDAQSIESLISEFKEIDCLYIADGHHRAAAASRVGMTCKKENPQHTGNEEYNYFLAVLFPENQMQIMGYHRVVADLNQHSESQILEAIKKVYWVSPLTQDPQKGQTNPTAKGELKLYLNHQWYGLKTKPEFEKHSDPLERLDVSVLQKNILGPILGIDDPRTNKRIDFIGGIRGLGEIQKRVDSGEMAIGFALYPTSIHELLAVADAGKIMPPKSTWFEPKLRDGLFIHFVN